MISTENMLQPFQIIYASLANRQLTQDEVRDLLHIARKNNHSVHVGGMLAYHDDCFLQVLEGPRIAVEAIYMRIKSDPRHRAVKLLLRCGVDKPQFDDWSMAYIDTDGKNKGIKGYVDYLKGLGNAKDSETQAMRVLTQFKNGDWRSQLAEDMKNSA